MSNPNTNSHPKKVNPEPLRTNSWTTGSVPVTTKWHAHTCVRSLLPTSPTALTPTTVLSILYVHPSHRRRGVASTLIKWGFDRADELNIESIVEATVEGKPCYSANGFRYISTFLCDPTKNDASPEWLALERKLKTPIPLLLMWRPKGGFVEGKTEVPKKLYAVC